MDRYRKMSKDDVYFSIFKKSYDSDPMAMYRTDNAPLRRKYERELEKW